MADAPADKEPVESSESKAKTAPPKKGWLNWERDVEILKIGVTLYAACIGTFVTYQFNERQSELARIEAISKMLPNLGATSAPAATPASVTPASATQASQTVPAAAPSSTSHSNSGSHLMRDGAMWAIFRTANNKTMLRDLAALFPEDIYRVVSSIAAAGELNSDKDAITALQVSSEKLANRLASTNKQEMASRLYEQAVRLREHQEGKPVGFTIVDINDEEIDTPPTTDHLTPMLVSLNKLAEMHRQDAEGKRLSTGRWSAKQMYKRVRQLGMSDPTNEGKLEVAKADLALAHLYLHERRLDTVVYYMKEALKLNEEALGPQDKIVGEISQELAQILKSRPGHETESKTYQQKAANILGAR